MRFKNFGLEQKDEKGRVTVVKCSAKAKGAHGLDINVPYGEEVEIPEIWAQPGRYQNGSRKPSPIEQVAPQLKPALDTDREVWEQVPPEVTKPAGATPQQLSMKALAAQLGMSEGAVALLMDQVRAARAAGPSAGPAKGEE